MRPSTAAELARLRAAARIGELRRLVACAGVRASRIEHALRLLGDDVEFLTDDLLVVRATASTDIIGYIVARIRAETPEWLEEKL